jgi:glycosyltransferase involved in cell wall biosynthesis
MRFTVVTPTYNRAPLLGRVFESLCAQTFRDFEWVIVDDGSTDGTGELVQSWQAQNPGFDIRYFWQVNRGTHYAVNFGIKVARGDLFTQLDSDDACIPTALERFDYHWRQLREPERYCGVIALCCQPDGSVLGPNLPHDYIDCFSLGEALTCDAPHIDRWGTLRTEVVRHFLYPEIPGEKFIVPAVSHYQMQLRYASRYFNEALKIAYYAPGHMSSYDLRWANPRGAFKYHRELAMLPVPLKVRLKSALNAARFAPLALTAAARAAIARRGPRS